MDWGIGNVREDTMYLGEYTPTDRVYVGGKNYVQKAAQYENWVQLMFRIPQFRAKTMFRNSFVQLLAGEQESEMLKTAQLFDCYVFRQKGEPPVPNTHWFIAWNAHSSITALMMRLDAFVCSGHGW